jgi:hypothetical protein
MCLFVLLSRPNQLKMHQTEAYVKIRCRARFQYSFLGHPVVVYCHFQDEVIEESKILGRVDILIHNQLVNDGIRIHSHLAILRSGRFANSMV